MKSAIIIGILTFSFTLFKGDPVKDYIGVPGPLKFDSTDYFLSWSSSQKGTYFKQEYLPENSTLKSYKKMISIEALTGDFDLTNVINLKIAELNKRKKTDPLVNYEIHNNSDKSEYLLDFLVSDGKSNIGTVEWNAYRYRLFKDKSGNHGVMIFALTMRESGQTEQFLNSLGEIRKQEVGSIEAFQIPPIQLN